MSHLANTAIACGTGLIIGNFLWAAFWSGDFSLALRISYFQAIALAFLVWRA